MIETFFFYVFSVIAVISALMVVFNRDPVKSAVSLVLCFLQVAAIYVLLRSPFLAAVQVFVYVGAVVVLFLFVVMVLELKKERLGEYLHVRQKPLVVILVLVLFVGLGSLILKGRIIVPKGLYSESFILKEGVTETLGKLLFTKYIFPFEVVSLLLLVALIGAILLTFKKE